MAQGTCSVDGCERTVRYRGWCNAHYARWLASGDVRADEPVRPRGRSLEEYFWAKVDKNASNGCWVWTGSHNRNGYGMFSHRTGTWIAHRLAYKMLVGAIPEGLQLDHLCLNKPCVNPAHLEPVTHAENMRRRFALLTHCKRGHEQTDANVIVGGDGGRRCRLCQRDRIREWKKRRADAGTRY